MIERREKKKEKKKSSIKGSEMTLRDSLVLLLVALSLVLVYGVLVPNRHPSGPRVSTVMAHPLSKARLHQITSLPMENMHEHTKKLAIVRVPGTTGIERARQYILDALGKAKSFVVETDVFVAATPKGQKLMTNIVATWNPKERRRVVVAAHYDSKWFPEPNRFVAALDSAVSCAMMLDLVAMLDQWLQGNGGASSEWGIQFVFFDGEEAFEEWSATDSIYGARHLAAGWGQESLDRIELFILLDLIGAPRPRFYDWFTASSPQWKDMSFTLRHLKRLGVLHDNDPSTTFFGTNPGYSIVEDDHLPFLRAHVPVLHLIAMPFPSSWHTVQDNLDSLDAATNEDVLKLLRCYVTAILNLTRVHEEKNKPDL